MLPAVALVGRPNVGKSTLFNAITNTRDALVADEPGVTRDRHYGVCRSAARPFVVVDTGGLTDDRELLDDVIVEIRQAIEMTSIYRDDIKGTRELFSSILDNRLNNAMKYLTSITLLMAVPTVISGLYGMNVQSDGMPFANTTAGFAIVLGLTLALCVFAAWVLHKKHML